MCEQKPLSFPAKVAAFFSAPTAAKASPSIAVASMDFFGLSVGEFLQLITLIYTVCLLIGAIPNTVRSICMIRNWLRKRHEN